MAAGSRSVRGRRLELDFLEGMRAVAPETASSGFSVTRVSATEGFAVLRVDASSALGLGRVLGTDLSSAFDAARAFDASEWLAAPKTDAPAALGLGRVLRADLPPTFAAPAFGTARSLKASPQTPAPEKVTAPAAVAVESRPRGAARVFGDEVAQSFGGWLRQRPKAAWGWLREQTRSAWEPEGDDPSVEREAMGDMGAGASGVPRAFAAADRARGKAGARATAHLTRLDARAEGFEARALRLDGRAAARADDAQRLLDLGKSGAAKRRERSAQRLWAAASTSRERAQTLRGEKGGVVGTFMRFRRGANEAAASTLRTRAAWLALPILLVAALVFGVAGAAIAGTLSVVSAAAAANSQQADVGSLSGVEAEVARYFRGKGLSDVSIAAIMGNIAQESGFDPACNQSGGGPGRGLFQWEVGGRFESLLAFAAARGGSWTDVGVQLDFMWSEAPGMFDTYSDFLHVYGTGAVAGLGQRMSFEEWCAIDDLDWATEAFERVFTRASLPMMDQRIEYARGYLAQLKSGLGTAGGQDYASASARQRAVADAARASTYGVRTGRCQAWVYRVYAAAGVCDASSCCAHSAGDAWIVSTSASDIPVGATVYVSRSVGGVECDCGRDAGHVGIYIGDGQVASRRGGDAPYIETLESFMDNYGLGGYMGWGFNGGVDLRG
ncbi:phage tail tip lysozyme [Rubneribacter sp.]